MRDPGEVQRDLHEIIIGENFISEATPYLLKIADIMKEMIETHERKQDRHKFDADLSTPASGYQHAHFKKAT